MNCRCTKLSEQIKTSIFARKKKSLLLTVMDQKPAVVLGAFGNYERIPVFEIHLRTGGQAIDYSSASLKSNLVVLIDGCGTNQAVRLVIYDEMGAGNADPILQYDPSDPEGCQDVFGYIAIGFDSPSGTVAMGFIVFCGKETSFLFDSDEQGIRHFFACSHLLEKFMGGENYDHLAARNNPIKL